MYASRDNVISMAARSVALVFAITAAFEIVSTLLNLRMWLLSWQAVKHNPIILAYPIQSLVNTFFAVVLALYLLISGRIAKKLLSQYTDFEKQVSLGRGNIVLLTIRAIGVYSLFSFMLYLLRFISIVVRNVVLNYGQYHQRLVGLGSFLFKVIFIQNFHVILIICPLHILLIYYLLNRGDLIMNFILNGRPNPAGTSL